VIDVLRAKHPIGLLCRVAKISQSGYYAWLTAAPKRIRKDEEDCILAAAIRKSCGNKLGKKGYRQISMRFPGTNHKRIARVMKKYNLQAKIRRANPYRHMPKNGTEHVVAPNLVNRTFAHALLWPHRVFGTDITYIPIKDGRGWAYLSTIKDLCTGMIVAHALSLHPDAELVSETLDCFSKTVPLAERLGGIIHSDQGCTYTTQSYQVRVRQFGLKMSMSRRGNCIDNASMETFFGHLKDELPETRSMYFWELRECINSHILYYNTGRKQWNRNKMTPVEYRDHLLCFWPKTFSISCL
jgi:transposase InsO family protein